MQLTIEGMHLVGGEAVPARGEQWRATDPRLGAPVGPAYADAGAHDVDAAVAAAVEAAATGADRAQRAQALRACADLVDEAGDELIEVCDRETGLGRERIEGERARTTAQFRLFADVAESEVVVEPVLDRAAPDARPPRPDLRRMLVPLGPTAVFGAGNFPLALSVTGSDTASALAAGAPVVVKAHPGHPATSELCGRLIQEALARAGVHPGFFSLLHGRGHSAGTLLVLHAGVKAVAFTGSLRGGRALFDLAASRPEPIPCYAEMGSLNPIFVSPAALAARGPAIGEGLAASVTGSTGQMCTKPGVVFVPDDDGADELVAALAEALAEALAGRQPSLMLNPGLHEALATQLSRTRALPGVEVVAEQPPGDELAFPAVVLRTDLDTWAGQPQLAEEHFGPVTVVVRTPRHAMQDAAARLPGSLTATLHAEAEDREWAGAMLRTLATRAGRVIVDGYPTGVSVGWATSHGGPYPATTSPGHTSIGVAAVRRFLRPVAYQNVPDDLLPPELQDANPLGLTRVVDGRATTEPLAR